MAQLILVNLDNPANILEGYGTGALLQLERDTTSAFAAPVTVGAKTITAEVSQYEFWDAAGTPTSWYRSRVTRSDATSPSEWSDAFLAGAPQTYATLDSLAEYLNLPDERSNNLLLDLLVAATDYITAKCKRDFFRHPPVSGTEVRLYAGSGHGGVIDVRAGIVSLTSVELALATGGTYNLLAATDYALWPPEKADDMSYEGVELLSGNYDRWYAGHQTVRLTGVFGWESVPPMVRHATLELAREWYRQGPGGGGPVGVNQYGTPIFGGGEPKVVRDVIARYGWRSWVVA